MLSWWQVSRLIVEVRLTAIETARLATRMHVAMQLPIRFPNELRSRHLMHAIIF